GFEDKFVRDPNKTPDLSQRSPHNCLKYGNIDGLYCRQCALLGKKLKEVWFTICEENEIFQDFLNTFESSNDNTNVIKEPQEPFVFNQDPVPVISNPEPFHNQNVDEFPQTLPSFHPTCYPGDENSFAYDSTPNFVDDSPNDFNSPSQPPTYSFEFCGNDAHYSHDYAFGNKQYKPEDIQELIRKLFNDVQNIHEELAEYINTSSWNRPAFYNYDDDDDEDYNIAITPVLPTEEPVDSLIMEDEHLDTVSATESDEIIKSSVENLDFSDSNDDSTSIDDDYFSIDDIDYVEASPTDSELVSLEEVKDDILHEKLLNIHLLIAKIESLNDNPTLDRVLKSPSPFPIPVEDSDSFFEKSDTSLSYSDNSLPEFETFSNHTEETSSGSTTTHADYSLLEYDSFIFEIEPDQGELTRVVMKDILGEPRVHVPNVLPTYLTLYLDSDFIPSDDSLRSDFEVSFLSRTRNKIFDPGIFFEVQSKNFLSRDTFYISFIRGPLCPVIETLLPFSSKNEDQVFNLGILSSNEEKSPHLLSHRGFKAFQLSSESPMIYGGNIPILDVPFLHFCPP
nr:hypothetical protein [Tanacetum cinerariifolium]